MSETHDHPGEQAGTDPVRLLDVRDAPLSLDEVFAAVGDSAAGGTALFVGTVRDHDGGAGVTRLGYSAHPSAVAELRRVQDRARAGSPSDEVADALDGVLEGLLPTQPRDAEDGFPQAPDAAQRVNVAAALPEPAGERPGA